MDKIYTSASKLVFILMALAVIIGMFMGIIESKDFMVLASMSFVYYFTKQTPSDQKSTVPNTKIIGGGTPGMNG